MRIGMVAPLEMRVPPVAYGGTEMVVSLLTEELVRRGHDVTLFASGDSVTCARLISICPRFLRGSGRDVGVLTLLNTMACLEHAEDFDVIHNHTTLEGMATAGLVQTPVLTTLHGDMKGDLRTLFLRYKGWFNTISRSAKDLLPVREGFAGVVHNAIDHASYPYNAGPREDFLLFLSRMSAEKGPHIAIRVARRLGRRIVLAGNVDAPDRAYFESRVLPLIDGDRVRYAGEAGYDLKRQLFSKARCLLAPLCWAEPFGLFMAEAMACGTPVIAFDQGAAPEVVADGITGFIVQSAAEMADAVGRIGEIDPQACRSHVARKFNPGRMTDDYLAIYERILLRAPTRAVRAPALTPSGRPPAVDADLVNQPTPARAFAG